MRYPAPGSPELAELVRQTAGADTVQADTRWGLDHGTWSVLARMYPAADIPVVQLSLDVRKTPAEHYALAQSLAPLRRQGVLILGSGNLVHNLPMVCWDDRAYPWAQRFDTLARGLIEAGDMPAWWIWQPARCPPRHPHQRALPASAVYPAARSGQARPGSANRSRCSISMPGCVSTRFYQALSVSITCVSGGGAHAGAEKGRQALDCRPVCQAASLLTCCMLQSYMRLVYPDGLAACPVPLWRCRSLWSLAAGGATQIHQSSVVLSVGPLASAVVAGGALRLGLPAGQPGRRAQLARKAAHSRTHTRPARCPLRWARYLVLAGIMAATISTSRLCSKIMTRTTLFSLDGSLMLTAAGWPGYLVTLVMLAGSLLIAFLWHFCPLGGLLTVQRVALSGERNNAACIDCKRCDKACP